jgi:hypothetical protein
LGELLLGLQPTLKISLTAKRKLPIFRHREMRYRQSRNFWRSKPFRMLNKLRLMLKRDRRSLRHRPRRPRGRELKLSKLRLLWPRRSKRGLRPRLPSRKPRMRA